MAAVLLKRFTAIRWNAYNGFSTRVVHLVVLACNTASAKALRTIQQT